MQFTAQQLADLLEGTLEGNPHATVHTFSKIEEGFPGSLSFLANPKYEPHLYTTKASVLIVSRDLSLKHPIEASLIRVPNPYLAFSSLLTKVENLRNGHQKVGIGPMASIAESAVYGDDFYLADQSYVGENVEIGKNVKIHPHCFIGDQVKIGDNTVIHAGVKVYHHCEIGNNCIVHAGTVIGSDGFGFVGQSDGSYQKIPQVGNVVIENGVEIGANCCIDRATLDSTIIRNGVKLDNLIQVAHNVVIDEHTVIAAQTGISGSTQIGKRCMVGGQVGFVGHIVVADGSKINAQSGVSKSIKEKGKAWNGSPARDFRESYKSMAHLQRFPALENRIKQLEKQLEEVLKRFND